MPQLSSYGFSLHYKGHWGVRLRLESGRLQITVPPSDLQPIDVRLPDRTVFGQPGGPYRLLPAG